MSAVPVVDEDGVVVRMISDLLQREEIGNREASFLVARRVTTARPLPMNGARVTLKCLGYFCRWP